MNLTDAYEIGHLVYENFDETVPLREIAESEGLRLNQLTLHRCLAAYRVCTNLGFTPDSSPLSFAYLVRLDMVPEKQQKKMLNRCLKEKWSAKQLENEIVRTRKRTPQTRGRKPLPRFVKAVHQLEKFRDGNYELLGDVDRVGELDADTKKKLIGTIKDLQGKLKSLEKSLK